MRGGLLPTIADDSHEIVSDSDALSIDNSFASNDSSYNNRNKHNEEEDELAREESRAVCWLRGIVLGLLITTTLIVTIVVYLVAKNSELNDFETNFEIHSKQVLTHMEYNLFHNLGTLETLAVTLSSYVSTTTLLQPITTSVTTTTTLPGGSAANAGGSSIPGISITTTTEGGPTQEWPFVTIPDFAIRVGPMLDLTQAFSIGFAPLVSSYGTNNRTDWETYITEMEEEKDETSEGDNNAISWIDIDKSLYTTGFGGDNRRTRRAQQTKTRRTTTTMEDDSDLKDYHRQQQQQPHRLRRGDIGNDSSTTTTPTKTSIHHRCRHLQQDLPSPNELNFPDFSLGYSSSIYRINDYVKSDGTIETLRQVEDYVEENPGGSSSSTSTTDNYLPIWQNSQVVPSMINYNILSSQDIGYAANTVLTSQQSIVAMWDLDRIGNPLGEAFQNAWEPDVLGDNFGDPFQITMVPIFDNVISSSTTAATTTTAGGGEDDDGGRMVVGVVTMISYWSTFVDNLLPNEGGTQGLVMVLLNECYQTYTYEINGPNVIFLGRGDLHETDFDDVFYESKWENFDDGGSGVGFGANANVNDGQRPNRIGSTKLNTNDCTFTVRIYPSARTQAFYITSKPGIYTFAVVVVFLFAMAIFLSYDCIVERRQKMVLKTAVENRAIVASLFPEAIRDRLFNNSNNDREERQKRIEATLQQSGLLGGSQMSGQNVPVKIVGGVPVGGPNGGDSSMMDASAGGSSMMNSDASTPMRLSSFVRGESTRISSTPADDKPIADLFPDSTVMFGDIAGFTAWSSQREPTQVFTLLQTLYQAFDKIAKKLGVFKIETIGDCYVAVTGVPEPQDDHAIRMARFARECIYRMQELVKRLEVTLGPDTGDLCLRVGLHSGPVTAGVLKGERSRFQLFGDTVNTAARMESTGVRNRIQCSVSTAELLRKGGKGGWLFEREDKVVAKGKGEMKTYFIAGRGSGMTGESDHMISKNSTGTVPTPVKPNSRKQINGNVAGKIESTGSQFSASTNTMGSGASMAEEDEGSPEAPAVPLWTSRMVQDSQLTSPDEKEQRLIDWHVDLMSRLLKRIVARRDATSSEERQADFPVWSGNGSKLVADEVADSIPFLKVDPHVEGMKIDPDSVVLGEAVVGQLREFVGHIANMYRQNAFHNFEHASHVTMNTNKLFNRIVTAKGNARDVDAAVLEYTSRIKYDPLVHFAVVLSAVIHDVDHMGISNMDLINDNAEIAELYGNRSVAEQNSVDVAWELLMDTKYEELQHCIYKDQDEFDRFRQIVVNMVMATDIFDKDSKAFREKRWKSAFEGVNPPATEEELNNLRATVMLEHTIQASDVGHAMQHWQIFRKWNERLFEEMVSAFEIGISQKDPIGGWFEGEIMFYDKYIIPLAKKLLDSRAFGVAGDEYLSYALDNRQEWGAKGPEIVREMASKYHRGKILDNMLLQNPDQHNDDPSDNMHRSSGMAA